MSRHELHNPGRTISLRLGGFHAEAFSISGLSTQVAVPSMDLCFDLGHCSVEASHCRHVLLSHAHQDHSLGVIRHISLRAMTSASAPHIYLPAESLDAMTDVLMAFRRMERRPAEALDAHLHGVCAGEVFAIGPKRNVSAFDVVHRLPSRGYTLTETRRRLRPAYRDLPGGEIKAAHERGEELYDYHQHQSVTYIGDSTIETLRLHPEVGLSDVLFLEATHLAGTSAELSARYGHTHIEELAALYRERPDTFGCKHIVLKHFSMKYSEDEISAALLSLPKGLRERVTLLV